MYPNSQYPMKGTLKKVCDYYDNCWEYTHTDLTGHGMIAPSRVDNTSGGSLNNIWAEFHYQPVDFPYPDIKSIIQLIDHIDESNGRTWSYSYSIKIINGQLKHYTFVGAQGAYPRLIEVSMNKTVNPGQSELQWLYEYYQPDQAGYDINYRGRSQLLERVTDRTNRIIADISYYVPETFDAFSQSLGRVENVISDEGILNYSYETCGEYSNEGFCTKFTKRRSGAVNGLVSKITIDDTTGYIKKITFEDSYGVHFSEQQYCYYTGSNKLAYFKEEYDPGVYHYTRYEYDSNGAMTWLVRNACPFNETTCAPIISGGCENNELKWHYRYKTDTDNMPIKIEYIDAPSNNYQSMKYEYYEPSWLLYKIYRKDTGGYNHISEFSYYTDGLLHISKDALGKETEYWYYNEQEDAVKNGKLKKVSYPANNDSLVKPTYYYTYCSDCSDPDNPPGANHFSGELIYGPNDPNKLQSSYYYDILERLEKTHLPNPGNGAENFSTTYAYDITDGTLRCTDSTDANGKVSRSCYDQYGNLIKQIQDYGQSNITTNYTYQNGLLMTITDANGYATSYAYDVMNRLIGIDYPDTSNETTSCPDRPANYDACYYYYSNGQLKKKVDTKRQSIRFDYDEQGRLLHKYYGSTGSSGISYTYQGQKLQSVADNRQSRTTSYTYDNYYRTASVTTPEGTLNYQYTENDRLISYQIPSTTMVSYSYYDDGSIKQISWGSSKHISYTYRLAGQRDTMTLPFLSTRAIKYDYDLQSRLTQIHNYKKLSGAGTILSIYSYAYDWDHSDPHVARYKGYRTQMDEYVNGDTQLNRTEKYDYDNLYQLIKSDYSGDLTDIFQWSYDSIANRIQQTTSNPSNTTNYAYYQLLTGYNSQLLRHDGGKCYIWDLNGNLLCTYPSANPTGCPDIDKPHQESSCPSSPLDAAGQALYSWDEDDRLVDLKWYYGTSEQHAQYYYDFNGNRYQKTIIGNTATKYLYHNEDIIMETIGNNDTFYIHSPGIDEPAFICPNDSCSNPYYYFADDLGSIRQIIDDANNSNIENIYRYGSWGELSSPFSKSESISNPYAYTAREFSEDEIYYYRWRYYQSYSARFISKDIVINKFSNAFSYAKNNPLIYIDPYGTQESLHGCFYTDWKPVNEKDIEFSKCREKSRKITRIRWRLYAIGVVPRSAVCNCWWEQAGCEGVIKLWCNIACYRKVTAVGCPEKDCPGPLQRPGCEIDKEGEKLDCTVNPDKRMMTKAFGADACKDCKNNEPYTEP